MAYGLNAVGLFLGMLTIFLSRSLSDELVNRQIFLITTKPVPRWQFVLGKWVGMVVLNAVFLSFSGLAIYGMVHYIKYTHPPIDDVFDEAELNEEVLVARHAVKFQLPDFSRPAENEFQRNREEGLYADSPDFDQEKELARLAKKYEARWRIIGPLELRTFEFENVLCERSPDKTVQIRYKTNISAYAPDEVFRAQWEFGDPLKGTPTYRLRTRHVVDRFHTMSVPADAVAPDHTLVAILHNQNPFPGEPQFRNVIEIRPSEDVEALFVVGSFGGNLFRLLILMMSKLMFLAGVALLMTTVFSFPVACLTSFTVYILAGARSFITESIEFATNPYGDDWFIQAFLQTFAFVFNALKWVVPDFGYFNAIEDLVNGRNVSLVWVLQAVGGLAVLKTAIMLGLAMLLFQRREVAEVSV
jgi:ABC-type transport system involved in multi-copper enzyme maturation permease subunit